MLTRAASPPIRTLILADVYARYAFAFFSRADGKSPVAGSAADIFKAGVVIHQYAERAVFIGFGSSKKHEYGLRAGKPPGVDGGRHYAPLLQLKNPMHRQMARPARVAAMP